MYLHSVDCRVYFNVRMMEYYLKFQFSIYIVYEYKISRGDSDSANKKKKKENKNVCTAKNAIESPN